jgi:UDP:flavonoid glycosyltransferase YjiC (YdhE family)
MSRPLVLVYAMPPVGHFQRLRPVVAALARAGLDVVVATDRRFQAAVERCGARFDPLFERHPLDGLDEGSQPPPVRFVTFAGRYAEEVVAEAAALEPDVVVYDTFAVIGRVVGVALGVPYVNVCSGHDRVPARVLAGYRTDPRVRVSAACLAALQALRERFGLQDASHLSWVDGASPYLNLYCEPPAFLSEEGRQAFAPVVCVGSLAVGPERGPAGPDPWGPRRAGVRRVLVCLGSVGWRLFHEDASRAVGAIVDAIAERDDVEAIVSLGLHDGTCADETLTALSRPNVRAAAWVDQWAALEGADAFVTHAGLNSVHEAIYHRVPMVAYPLFADQPALTAICVERGAAVRLVDELRAPVGRADVHRALDEVAARHDELQIALGALREWELEVIAGRPAAVARVAELARVKAVA